MARFTNVFNRTALCSAAVAVALLSGCSGSVQPDPAPKPLTHITETTRVEGLWSHGIGSLGRADYPIAPALDNGVLYAANAKGELQAFHADTGRQLWEQALRVPVSSPITADAGQLYLGTRKGEVLALDASNGALRWRAQVASEVLTAPQVNTQLVLVQSVDGTLTALDRLTGHVQWVYAASQPTLTLRTPSTPRTIDQVTFAGFANGRLALFANNDGHMMWDMRLAIPRGASEIDQLTDVSGQPVLTEDGHLFATSYHGQLVSLNVRTGEPLWSHDLSSYRSPVYNNGTLYVVDDRSHLMAFDAATGAQRWTNDQLEGRNVTAPLVMGQQLVVGDLDGYLHVINADTGAIEGRRKAGGNGVALTPLSDGERLFVMTQDGHLIAYRLAARKG